MKTEKTTVYHEGDVPYITFPILSHCGVKHGFSTRLGGVSSGIFASMNLDFRCADPNDNVLENYRRMTAALDIKMEDLVLSMQTHTTNILRMTSRDRGKGFSRERDYTDVDGMITNDPDVALVGLFADCVPVFFVDPVHRAIGLSHAGWRGTVGKIAEKTVVAMGEAFGTAPENLCCVIGPSICRDCYEVSADVAEAFRSAFAADGASKRNRAASADVAAFCAAFATGGEPEGDAGVSAWADPFRRHDALDGKPQKMAGEAVEAERNLLAGAGVVGVALSRTACEYNGENGRDHVFLEGEPRNRSGAALPRAVCEYNGETVRDIVTPKSNGKFLVNLQLANALTLIHAGVPAAQVSIADLCTCCRSDLLWSHRATKGLRGEMAGFLQLDPSG